MSVEMSAPPGDTVTAMSGEAEFEINRDVGKDLMDRVERINGFLDAESSTYASGGKTELALSGLKNTLEDITEDYHSGNRADLNHEMLGALNNLENLVGRHINDSLEGKANTSKTEFHLSFVSGLLGEHYAEPTAKSKAPAAAGKADDASDMSAKAKAATSDAATAGDGEIDTAAAEDYLAKAETADTSGEKASLLKSAIASLIGELTGGAEGASDDGGSDASSATDPAEDAAASAEPNTTTETVKLEGDALMGRLNAGGAALTYDKSDGGVGVDSEGEDETDEIDGQERLTFTPGGDVDAAEVVVEDLFGGRGGEGQKVATINVVKDGEVVDRVQVLGDMDGTQTVRIDTAFDKLVFVVNPHMGDASGSFAISSITTEKEKAVESGSTPATIVFEAGTFVGLLESLSVASENVDAGLGDPSAFGETAQLPVMELIGELMTSIAAELKGDDADAPTMTAAGAAAILEDLNALVEAIDDADGTETSKSETLEALRAAVAAFAEDLGD